MAKPIDAWLCTHRHLHYSEVDAVTCEVRIELCAMPRLTSSAQRVDATTFVALLEPTDVKKIHALIGRVVEALEREEARRRDA